MSQSDFAYILSTIDTLSPEQTRTLSRELESRLASQKANGQQDTEASAELTEAEQADQALQRGLFDAGLLSEIKPPIRDLTCYRERKAVPIKGEPLSETVIRERR